MDKNAIIENTINFVKEKHKNDTTGHDWWHVYRVWKMATQIATLEKADLFVVEMSALLHDVADWKLYPGNEETGIKNIQTHLKAQISNNEIIEKICDIIKNVSFKGAKVTNTMNSIEGKIVQDADRLDATGAIGIARAFAYGGSKNREMHNPEIKPTLHNSFEAYKQNQSTTINHFYEKLLLLEAQMHTQTAQQIAKERTEYMKLFLNQFFNEWEVNLKYDTFAPEQ